MEVTVHQNGKKHFLRFENGGKPSGALKVIGDTDKHGSVVRFKADASIFTETQVYSFDTLNTRIRQLAFLNKGIRLVIIDEREEEAKRIEYKYDGGIRQYVEYLNKNKNVLHEDVIYVEGLEEGILAEVALQYNDGYMPNIYSFCNKMCIRDRLRTIGKLSFIPSLFNINEPLIFGLPLMYNPIMMIPFIIVMPLNGLITYLAMSSGLVARTFAYASWNMFSPIAALIDTMDFKAVLLIIFLIVVDILIYLPFFKAFEKEKIAEEGK